MRIAIPVLMILAAAACTAHHPSAQMPKLHPLFSVVRGPSMRTPAPQPGVTCLLSTTKCAELMAQAPPRLCLLSSGRCPSYGSVVPLARLDPR